MIGSLMGVMGCWSQIIASEGEDGKFKAGCGRILTAGHALEESPAHGNDSNRVSRGDRSDQSQRLFRGQGGQPYLIFPDGSKKTIGLIYPGQYHFGTDKAERMELTSGQCAIKVDGTDAPVPYSAGQAFDVPGKSGFDIEVKAGICEYICSYLG